MPLSTGSYYNTGRRGDAPSEAMSKSVLIESSEIVQHVDTRASSRISYPTFSTWQKQQNCINKLKTLSQQHVTDKRQQVTGVHGDEEQKLDSSSTPVVSDDSSEAETSFLSPAYETFSAIAGVRSKKSRDRDKKPIPLYQFLAELIKNASKSASCVRSMNPVAACAPVGGNYHHHQNHYHDQFKAQMEDDFDASTFDSIMDGIPAHRNGLFSVESYQDEQPTIDDSLATSFNDYYE